MKKQSKCITYQYFRLNHTTPIISVKKTLTLFFLVPTLLYSQTLRNPMSKDLYFFGAQSLWSIGNYLLDENQNIPSNNFLIKPIDYWHYSKPNKPLQLSSDITFFSTMGTAGILGLMHWENGYVNIMSQNLWLTANLTQSVKILTQRKRPATFNKADDTHSFFSGHSSLTATTAATALWYAYAQPNPKPWTKPLAWSAVGLSISTGVLRILSGKHYPSDVLAGWAIGTGVALLNIQLHKIGR